MTTRHPYSSFGGRLALACALQVLFLAGPVVAQQQVRGELPEGVFVIDPAKKSEWNDRVFSGKQADFAARQVEVDQLGRWTHEFPTQHASSLPGEFETRQAELPQWTAWETSAGIGNDGDGYRPEERELPTKAFGSLVVNEKWARSFAMKESPELKSVPATDFFIAEVGIRPLDEQELQEKLNEFSRPSGKRTGLRSPLRTK